MWVAKEGHIINAHYSYLAALVQYGSIFAAIVFMVLIVTIVNIYKSYLNNKKFSNNSAVQLYIFILSFTIVSSIFYSLMFGVNAFHGFMFWVSLTVLNYKLYYMKKDT